MRLTLKQLGYLPHQVDAAVARYSSATATKTDQGFLRYVGTLPHLTDHQKLQIESRALLPTVWQPAPGTRRKLVGEGFSEEAIDHYRSLFVLQSRENRRILAYPDAAFLRFCRSRPGVLANPMPLDWLPSKAILTELQNHVCPDLDYITDQISRFVEYQRYRVSSDWDERFCQWVDRGWNGR